MDNPKIIFLEKDTIIHNENDTFKLIKNERYIVISETELTFFFKRRNKTYYINKSEVNKITYKRRTLEFNDLKKDEILNIFDNYNKLIDKCKIISSEISKYSDNDYDMSKYLNENLSVLFIDNFICLSREISIYNIKNIYTCKIPIKYLWDHNWKKLLKKEYDI